jgi:ComF family protein
MLKEVAAGISDLLFPRQCAGCGDMGRVRPDAFWCGPCWDELPWIQPPWCPICGVPYLSVPKDREDAWCGDCIGGNHVFDAARSAVFYEGKVRQGILQLKFGGKLSWVPALSELLFEAIARDAWNDQVDLITAVPLHRRRLRHRGFNQSSLLARALARRLPKPCRLDALERNRWTEPQTRLQRAARLENVKGAFTVKHPGEVEGRTVLLVDDVFTTGTTLNECARTLKKAGASAVIALTVARSIPEHRFRKKSVPSVYPEASVCAE